MVVKFEKPNKNTATFVLPGQAGQPEPGEVEQCSCETGQIILKRAVDELCCGIQQGGFNCAGAPGIVKVSSDNNITPTPVIVTRNGIPCTGPACCDTFVPPNPTDIQDGRGPVCASPTNWNPAGFPPAQPLTLGVAETSLNGGQTCAFDFTFDPNPTDNASFRVAPNGPCKLAAVFFASGAGNAFNADLLDRYLVQVNPNGVNGIVTFTVQDLAGVAHSFTVNTASLPSLGALTAAIASGYSSLDLGLSVSVVSLPTVAQIQSIPGGGGFTANPLILISNAALAAKSFGVKGQIGQYIVTETSAPLLLGGLL